MDEEKIFMSKEETIGFEITTNLTSENLGDSSGNIWNVETKKKEGNVSVCVRLAG